MIKTEIVAHSLSPQGDELISVLCTFPRIILAEVNTHRMLSKNTSSSRAIPFFRMVKSIVSNCFIPLAFQKHHSGMQGNTYLDVDKKYTFDEITDFLHSELVKSFKDDNGKWDKDYLEIDKALNLYVLPILTSSKEGLTLVEWWLKTRDLVVACAVLLYSFGVTKQLCNRLLEPFMWTTMLITGSKEGWDNFFNLRCPQYQPVANVLETFRSKKDAIRRFPSAAELTEINWFKNNKGQAEIHMMALAECIYDAMNESTPKQLKHGEWHIPFEEKIKEFTRLRSNNALVHISTAMGARTSYTVVGEEKEINFQKMIELHDRLISQDPPHSSPLEHCARAMSDEEYECFLKGEREINKNANHWSDVEYFYDYDKIFGWCNNLKGFIPYRYMIDNNLI